MTIKRAKGAKAKADKFFSLIVRAHGECENCGSRNQLQTAHIISRRYSAVRCDLANAFCLCAGCHRHFTDHPLDFTAFCYEQRSHEMLDALRDRAHFGGKVDWAEVADRLADEWKAISA